MKGKSALRPHLGRIRRRCHLLKPAAKTRPGACDASTVARALLDQRMAPQQPDWRFDCGGSIWASSPGVAGRNFRSVYSRLAFRLLARRQRARISDWGVTRKARQDSVWLSENPILRCRPRPVRYLRGEALRCRRMTMAFGKNNQEPSPKCELWPAGMQGPQETRRAR